MDSVGRRLENAATSFHCPKAYLHTRAAFEHWGTLTTFVLHPVQVLLDADPSKEIQDQALSQCTRCLEVWEDARQH